MGADGYQPWGPPWGAAAVAEPVWAEPLKRARCSGLPWRRRMVAAAELDRLLLASLRQEPESAAELCRQLGLLEARGGVWCPSSSARAAGYEARSWAELRAELKARLTAWPSSPAVQSGPGVDLRWPSRWVVVRHVVSADDVVAEIRSRVRVSRGSPRAVREARGLADDEARQALDGLPEYERAVARGLAAASDVYWSTPSCELGAPGFVDDLVERPAGTVALVVRPPGSDWELEIKRSGMAGRLGDAVKPLSFVASPVFSHRLAGGSTVPALVFEASAGACLAVAYRRVHGVEAPISRTLALRVVLTVPSHDGAAFLTDYFSQRRLFGAGYDAMRSAVDELIQRDDEAPPESPFGAATAVLQRFPPGQSLLSGSSALRLDGVAARLSADAPHGFADPAAPPAPPSLELDDLLALVLDGVDTPLPQGADRAGVAMAGRGMRDRARSIYLRHMDRLGTLWGTVWGLGGYSHGESFVGRNLGLRRRWKGGRPRVELVFMDHDNLHMPAPDLDKPLDTPSLAKMLGGSLKDELAVFGGALRGRYLEGSAELLERIYRIDPLFRDVGRARLHDACRRAYCQTRAGLFADTVLQEIFPAELGAVLERRDAMFQQALGAASTHASVDPKIDTEPELEPETEELLRLYQGFLSRYRMLFAAR